MANSIFRLCLMLFISFQLVGAEKDLQKGKFIPKIVQERKFKQAISYLELMDGTFPATSIISYILASTYCIDGQNAKALKSLKKAISLGFNNIEQIKKDKTFDPIRRDPEFKKIIESLESPPK